MATDPVRAARERKQKIFVAVGGIVLLLLLAFQLPRLLGGSETSSAAPTTDTTVGTEPTPGTPRSTGVPVALVDTDRRHAPAQDKLRSFSVFSKKDPFEQQVVEPPTPEISAPTTGGSDGKGQAPSKGFKPDQKPTLTIISVNGARQVLQPGAAFPTADPVFVLVAEQAGAKRVVIGIKGGSYSGGAKTTKLRVGKPIVLVNTTTGARYRVVLIAVGTGEAEPTKAPKS